MAVAEGRAMRNPSCLLLGCGLVAVAASLQCGGGASPSVDPPAGAPAADLGADDGLAGGAAVTFTIDLARGPARQFQPPSKPVKVSPYVYGINAFAIWETTTHWGLARQGGDQMTPWNWTNNYSNSGSDYCFWEGQLDGGNKLAGAITASGTSFPISQAQSLGVAYLATVPIVDYVSATYGNNTGINGLCPGSPQCSSGSPDGYAVNSGNLTFATTGSSGPAFVANSASKPGGDFCTCQPGSTCSTGCVVDATGPVYADEFANFLKVNYRDGGAPVFFSLDNEPNYWPGTHPELYPHTGTPGCGTSGTVSFDDIVTRDTTYAAAIKKAWPTTETFGPIVAQDGIIYAGDYNDPNLPTPFADYYLGKMAAASASAGKALLDAFDVHYYTSNGSQSQCVQVPRMFWDPSFTDFTPAQTDSIDFQWSGLNSYFDDALYPRQMIPRLEGRSRRPTAAPRGPDSRSASTTAGARRRSPAAWRRPTISGSSAARACTPRRPGRSRGSRPAGCSRTSSSPRTTSTGTTTGRARRSATWRSARRPPTSRTPRSTPSRARAAARRSRSSASTRRPRRSRSP